MRYHLALITLAAALGLSTPAAEAALIQVDLSSQTMRVSSNAGSYVWPISSARSGYLTPRGTYGVQRLEAMHRSHKYHNSPMPHSIFFRGGYAIHGTYETGSLGSPASHGCIRISPGNAALLYQIVEAEGARIAIAGSPVAATRYARAERRRYRADPSSGYGEDNSPTALGYAAAPRYAPSYEDWMRSPAGYGRPGAWDYDPSQY